MAASACERLQQLFSKQLEQSATFPSICAIRKKGDEIDSAMKKAWKKVAEEEERLKIALKKTSSLKRKRDRCERAEKEASAPVQRAFLARLFAEKQFTEQSVLALTDDDVIRHVWFLDHVVDEIEEAMSAQLVNVEAVFYFVVPKYRITPCVIALVMELVWPLFHVRAGVPTSNTCVVEGNTDDTMFMDAFTGTCVFNCLKEEEHDECILFGEFDFSFNAFGEEIKSDVKNVALEDHNFEREICQPVSRKWESDVECDVFKFTPKVLQQPHNDESEETTPPRKRPKLE